MSDRQQKPPLAPGSAPVGARRQGGVGGAGAGAGGVGGGGSAAGGMRGSFGRSDSRSRDLGVASRGRSSSPSAFRPPLEGRLSSAALLAPATVKSVGSIASTPRDEGSQATSRRNSEAILDELERLSAQPSPSPAGVGPMNLQINALGPRVLSQQTIGNAGDLSSRAQSVMGGSTAGSVTGRETRRELKVTLTSRHRSASPARRDLDDNRSSTVRSQPSFADSLASSTAPPPSAADGLPPRPPTRARTAASQAESDMDAHLPPERNPWAVLEKLRQRPERAEFRYMMMYKRDAFTPANPYHLQVLPQDMIDRNDYFTLSLHGVTHYHKGVPEFLDLEEWKRERFIFDSVVQIPLFSRYLWWKPFRVWRNRVKYGKIAATKQWLESNLFLANPRLLSALHKLRLNCFGLFAVPLCSDATGGLHTLEGFSAAQEKQRGQVLMHMQSLFSDILGSTKATVEQVLVDLEEDFAKQQAQPAAQPQIMSAAALKVDLKGPLIKIPKIKKDEESAGFKYTLIAAQRSLHQRLHNFMRMCDYVVFSTLLDLVVFSVDGLCQRFRTGSGDISAMFLSELRYSEEEGLLYHSPHEEEFSTEVEGIAQSFVHTAGSGQRLLGHHEIVPLLHLAETESDLDDEILYAMVAQDKRYTSVLAELQVVCRRECMRCKQACVDFQPIIDMVEKNREFDIDGLEREAVDTRSDFDHFVRMIAKYRQEVEGIEMIPEHKDYSVIRVTLDAFKDSVAPSPASCLQQLCDLLPRLLMGRLNTLHDELSDFNTGLSRSPRSVEDFVAYVLFIEKVESRQDAIDNEVSLLEEERHQMEQAMATLSEADEMAYRMLFPELMAVRHACDAAAAQKDTNTAKWSKQLDEEVAAFKLNIKDMKMLVDNPSILDHDNDIGDVMQEMLDDTSDMQVNVEALEEQGQKIQQYQKALKRPVDEFQDLARVSADIRLKTAVWDTFAQMEYEKKGWKEVELADMDALKKLEAATMQWYRTALRAGRELPVNKVVPVLMKEAQVYRGLATCSIDLANSAMKERHWEKIHSLTGLRLSPADFVRDEGCTVAHVLKSGAVSYMEMIQGVATEATQELVLEEMLAKIKAMWVDAEFAILNYKDHNDVYVLGGVDEVQALMDESMTMVGVIMASRYVGGIRAEVDKLDAMLRTLQSTLDEWLAVQQSWLYLEPVLTAPDIQRQLPSESKLFLFVDHEYKSIMRRASENPNCMRVGTVSGQREMFVQLLEVLEKVQKSLEDYLEFKRTAFPRFYFLSNEELLDILAETRLVQAVQPHMIKCFDAIKMLDFGGAHPMSPVSVADEASVDIYGMISPEGEYVTLGKTLKARGEVEAWLGQVERRMVESLRQLARDCITDYAGKTRGEWILSHSAQVTILASQVFWCQGAEDAMSGDGPASDALEAQLKQHLGILKEECSVVRRDPDNLQRCQVVSLITIDVHNRDILESLLADGVSSKTEFSWQMRLRYYWLQELGPIGDCRIEQVMAQFLYSYEYLGASGRLVVTELTDRCYMTLTGAMDLMLGGAPAGPAGTGKTETTKDLGKALGRQCVVFNCGENLDATFMRKFFMGLAQCGAWACFDEFNRIHVEVLSVVAQQVLSIQNALRAQAHDFEFEGKTIHLVHTFGVFITMNPGYAGRSELPDNLKALFRPISMMVPDYALVAEVMLFAEGFDEAKRLAQKMVKLYKLSSEQLSQAKHYDFGMRAVKSVLVMAGARKRAAAGQSEDTILIAAMCDSNVPKFEHKDLHLFFAVVGDLFPGKKIQKPSSGHLPRALEASLAAGGLKTPHDFIHKGVELFETVNIRFGILFLGPTGGGKTTLTFALKGAITDMHSRNVQVSHPSIRKTIIYCFNPKSISLGELYGNYSPATKEWSDGLASSLVRMANNDTSDDKKWVLFDGPIDAVWVENMNTVLDDNQTLCLPNGERIKLSSNLRMLFETEDVNQASPATVSRLGVVYLPSATLGPMARIHTWIKTGLPDKLPQETVGKISTLMEWNLQHAIDFIRRECVEEISSVNVNLVSTCCELFGSLASHLLVEDVNNKPNENLMVLNDGDCFDLLKSALSFSIVWSVGSNLNALGKEKFSTWFRDAVSDLGRFPNYASVYDYMIDPTTMTFINFSERCSKFKYDPALPFSDVIVPTSDTTACSHLLSLFAKAKANVLLVGGSGVGKSVMVHNALSNTLPGSDVMSFVINFSAQTSSLSVQEQFESSLERKRKGVLGAPPCKTMACFVDDVNMPQREVYGAQPPIEMLRQVIDRVAHFRPGQGKNPPYAGGCGFYDRKRHFWYDIVDFVLLAACGPPGGGRNPVCPRFFRHFAMMNISPASPTVLKVIFSSILDGHLSSQTYTPEVKNLSKPMVDASIELYGRISSELLPTPAKSHYTFNIRDLSKVFQGVLSLHSNHCLDAKTFVMLWVHEAQRVFQDRLIDESDKRHLELLLHELVKRKFALPWDFDDVFVMNKPTFGDFFVFGAGDDKVYKACPDRDGLPKLMESYLAEYNLNTNKVMDLIFFRDAIEHISRVCRILRAPRGHAMLVGMGGSGRQSISRLASFISDCKCCELEITRGYGMSEFREDLKKIFHVAGVERKPAVLLVTDSQIVNEGFLEDINSILNSGEVANLFNADDKTQIASELKDMCLSLGRPATIDSAFKLFVQNVKAKLHIVMCMSQIGESFRTRCRQFPSLINCCTIDWFLPWPEEALHGVGIRLLGSHTRDADTGALSPVIQDVDDDLIKSLAGLCVTVHSSVLDTAEQFWGERRRRFYVSPKSFLDMISSFIMLLQEKRGALTDRRDKFLAGVKKMEEVAVVIEQSKRELNELQPVLDVKGKDLAVLLLTVQTDKDHAQIAREKVSQEARLVEEQAVKVRAIQNDAQKDLDEALPALESSIRALNSLTKADITEVKSFAKPPAMVQTVMEAVCVLLGQPATWDSAKKVLGQGDFMDQMINYDKDHIDGRTIKALKKYIDNPDFQPEVVGKVSKAAKGLCMWCRAMNIYAAVVKEVAPKKAALKAADEKLASAQAVLDAKSAELALTDERVSALEAKLELAKKDEEELHATVKLCEDRLSRASRLTSALGEEQVAWQKLSGELDEQLLRIVGDVMVASACISYYGPLSDDYRVLLVNGWVESCQNLGLQVSENFSVRATLASDVEVRDWTIHGLPSNRLSVDNGVIVTKCQRWPLLIDPQLQGSRWIKGMYGEIGKLRVTRLSESNWLRQLENAVQHGFGFMIEDVAETLDPSLAPVLLKQIYSSGGRKVIKLGDQEIDYDPEFRLYITSKMPNPHYLPEVCIQTTLVNFTVTYDGLEDQLLGEVVRKERPDLETQKDRIVVSMAADKKQLQDLQDRALQLLFESEGMILDNEPLVNTLQQSKQTSIIIERRFKEAEQTDLSISQAREMYRIVAKRGSLIYFVIADLAALNPMYQYSLEYFKRIYGYCIEVSAKSDDLDERLQILLSFVTSFMYKSVCRGLFEEHKALFSFLVCVAIQQDAGSIQPAEWNFLLRGGVPSSQSRRMENPAGGQSDSQPKLFTDASWTLLAALEEVQPQCAGIRDNIRDSLHSWVEWMESSDPYEHHLPAPYEETITLFNRLLLIRALRIEKVLTASSSWVSQVMGRSFTESPPIKLKEIFEDTTASTPIVFLLVSGSDPTAMIFKFAEAQNFSERLHSISLGQGQGPIAEKLIDRATKRGDWVCLMNCHVNTSWLPTLESIVGDIVQGAATHGTKSADRNFRLWLTSMPSTSFPVSILQVGIKITCEPPKGLRANIIGTLSDLGPELYDQSKDAKTWKLLLLSLAFFHAVVQERRKYGPIGWNIRYEFNASDFTSARDVLKMFVNKAFEEKANLPWEALAYVTGQINYGGRVTDAMDRRCLIATLERYYNPEILKTPNYKLSAGGAYYLPESQSFAELMEYLGTLPVNDDPEVFGMHENANLAFELRETERMIASALSIQPRERPVEGELTPEARVDAMCEAMLVQLPFDISKRPPSKRAERLAMEERIPSSDGSYMPNSLNTVLEQEMERFNTLGKEIRRTLEELRKALKGLVVMSESLESMFIALGNNMVPGLWARVSYLSLKPLGAWKDDYIRRMAFFKKWSHTGLPTCFWISGFFFPQGFLTGALQNHARRYKCAVDTLSFGFTMRVMESAEDVTAANVPDDGVLVDGMFLEGARWDRKQKKLRPGYPGQLLSPVPVIHFRPMEDYTLSQEDYHCPLYKTNERAGVLSTTGQSTNFILTVGLPSDVKPKSWVLQGTAMVTMTNM